MITNADMIIMVPMDFSMLGQEWKLFGLTAEDILFLKRCADEAGIQPPYNKNKDIKVAYERESKLISVQEPIGADGFSVKIRTVSGANMGSEI